MMPAATTTMPAIPDASIEQFLQLTSIQNGHFGGPVGTFTRIAFALSQSCIADRHQRAVQALRVVVEERGDGQAPAVRAGRGVVAAGGVDARPGPVHQVG